MAVLVLGRVTKEQKSESEKKSNRHHDMTVGSPERGAAGCHCGGEDPSGLGAFETT